MPIAPQYDAVELDVAGLKAASGGSFIRALLNRGVAARLRPGLFQLVAFELGREKECLGNPYVAARELMAGQARRPAHPWAVLERDYCLA